MAVKKYSTHDFAKMRVVGGKNGNRRIGKVRRFVFHPTEKRVVGFMVKRPDLLWMFHRKDRFVAFDGFEVEDGRIVVSPESDATDAAARKRLGLDWDSCVLWEGMPIVDGKGTLFGTVGDVEFTAATGKVSSITLDRGATNKALLGTTTIPAKMIQGFRTGIGKQLAVMGEEGAQEDDAIRGAILVSDEIASLTSEGGAAQAAGETAAKAGAAAAKTVAKAKPKVKAATAATGKAVNKGAYKLGNQIGKTKGMFGSFADEYRKAAADETSLAKKKKKR